MSNQIGGAAFLLEQRLGVLPVKRLTRQLGSRGYKLDPSKRLILDIALKQAA
jgi:hypothetical protein